MDLVKDIAAVLGVILSTASVLTLVSKNVRGFLASIIRKYGKSDEVETNITEIKELLEKMAEEDRVFRENQAEINDNFTEFMRNECRSTIKDIFYKYNDTKVLPLYEEKTLMRVKELYIEKLHGNSFASLLLDEMDKWEIDFTSEHPDEDA